MRQLNVFNVYPLFIVCFMMTLALTMPRTVFAQTTKANTLTIDRVWTADGNGTDKSVFAPKDAIRYVTLIRNTYTHPVTIQRFHFDSGGPTWPGDAGPNPAYRSIYRYDQRDVNVPVGQTLYYSPWTIPNSAPPGSYVVGITIYWHSPEDAVSSTATTNGGLLYSIPGSLATSVTTFLSDGVTPTSAVGAAGPGEALLYRITVTNTGLPAGHKTGVVLTDPLPPEIFDIIGTATTDHGTCLKTGSWHAPPAPSTTVTCQLGSIAFGETATISFTASIIVRDPSGLPRPPKDFVNTVYVSGAQQPRETFSVETAVNAEGISCEDYNKFVDAVESCVGLVPGIGTLADWVWKTIGKPLQGSCPPKSYPAALVEAEALGSKELLQDNLNRIGDVVGLKKVTEKKVTTADCLVSLWINYHDTH